jgi:hypothetical protein
MIKKGLFVLLCIVGILVICNAPGHSAKLVPSTGIQLVYPEGREICKMVMEECLKDAKSMAKASCYSSKPYYSSAPELTQIAIALYRTRMTASYSLSHNIIRRQEYFGGEAIISTGKISIDKK